MKAKISNTLKGNKNALGKVCTEEHKKKISESLKRNKIRREMQII